MKTLLIVRHGKSSWKDKSLKDNERPLKNTGKKQSAYMGKLLIENELIPQLILSSDALRASQTAQIIADIAGVTAAVRLEPDFYMAEPLVFIETLKLLPDTIERVMIVGHNPGLEALLQLMDGKIDSLHTGSMAYLVLNVASWSELNLETMTELVAFWEPVIEDSKEKKKPEDTSKSSDKKPKKEKKGAKTMKDKKDKGDDKDKKDKKDKKGKKDKKDKKGKKDKK